MSETAGGGAKAPALGSLGERIEWLIANRWPADAPVPQTNNDIGAAVTAATGEKVSGANIWNLRTGRSVNPTLKTLAALAKFFGVPIGYFSENQEEAESIGGQVALLTLLRDSGITGTALRSLVDLTPESREMIAEMIASAAKRERKRGPGA
jgi:transcriptional regulator with XRE-family HTH domain